MGVLMGLRCLIGHDYGDPQTARDRRQRGNEVVVTVTEYRECHRCGHRRVISENKEVTAEPAPEPESEDEPDGAAGTSWSAATAGAVDEPDETAELDLDEPTEPLSAAEDDGIILDDEPAEPVRGYGEWPQADRDDEPADLEGDHEPWPGEPPSGADDPSPTATTIEADADPGPDASDATAGAEPAATTDHSASGAPSSSGPGAEQPTASYRPDPRDTELVCPECSHSWPSVNGSLRPGDICPECRDGYIEERVIQ